MFLPWSPPAFVVRFPAFEMRRYCRVCSGSQTRDSNRVHHLSQVKDTCRGQVEVRKEWRGEIYDQAIF